MKLSPHLGRAKRAWDAGGCNAVLKSSRSSMLHLLLLRHATAGPLATGQADHDRPLTEDGRAEAAAAGRAIASSGARLDLVLCSTATRTRQTFEEILQTLDVEPEVRMLDRLFSDPDYLDVLRREGGSARSVMIVGHNPFIQETALKLAAAQHERRGELERRFPPATLAIFTGDGEWADFQPEAMRLAEMVVPG